VALYLAYPDIRLALDGGVVVAADGAAMARSARGTRHPLGVALGASSSSTSAPRWWTALGTRPAANPALDDLLARYVLAQVATRSSTILNSVVVFGMVLLKILVRREWAAVTAIAQQLHTARGLGDNPEWGSARGVALIIGSSCWPVSGPLRR
jgi:hypothetical protein